MGKISGRHYFNNRLKSEKINGEEYNPLYVQIVRKSKTHQIRSVFVTEKITEKQLRGDEIKRLCETETDFILSFFEFAESSVPDFTVSKSQTNLGKLLAFYNTNIWTVLNDYGFVDYRAREEINFKLKKYVTDKTDFEGSLIRYVVKDVNKDFSFDYLTENVQSLLKLGVLSKKEAGKIEFTILTYTLALDNYTDRRHLNLFDWFSNKKSILSYIEQKAKHSTKVEISEYAAEADSLLKSLFADFYNIIYYNLHDYFCGEDYAFCPVRDGKIISPQKEEEYITRMDEIWDRHGL